MSPDPASSNGKVRPHLREHPNCFILCQGSRPEIPNDSQGCPYRPSSPNAHMSLAATAGRAEDSDVPLRGASAPQRAESEAGFTTKGRIAWRHSWPLSTWGSKVTYLLGNLGRTGHARPIFTCLLGNEIPTRSTIQWLLRGWPFPTALVQHCLWLREKFCLILDLEMNEPIWITDLKYIVPFDSKKMAHCCI